jgi:hypothetical protein
MFWFQKLDAGYLELLLKMESQWNVVQLIADTENYLLNVKVPDKI